MIRSGSYVGLACVLALAACRPDDAAVATLDIVPRRVVSLAPSLTELLFTLGAGDSVVGVTRFCDRPPAAKSKTVVGDSKQLSVEAIVTLDPDVVLINSEIVAANLRPIRSRFPVVMAKTGTVDELLDSIDLVGSTIGVVERARALRAELEDYIRGARQRADGNGRGKVLVVLQRDPYYIAGPGSYVDELLGILGWQNAASGMTSQWPCVSAEALMEFAPDVILDTGFGVASDVDPSREVAEYWRRFENLPAVRSGRVYALTQNVVVRPGPALREALDALSELLSPRAAGR